MPSCASLRPCCSRPSCRGVDRNCSSERGILTALRRPRAGAWIETPARTSPSLERALSPLAQERGIAVTEEQIDDWNLPTRPTKKSDTRSKSFGSTISVELDAIDPNVL